MLQLQKLKKFNRSLVTTIETHLHPAQMLHSKKPSERRELQLMQYEDMLQAYLHIESNILPTLKDNHKSLTPATLLQWIKKIHQLMAKTILKPYEVASGDYSKQTMMEWLIEAEIHDALMEYLSSGALETDVHDDLFIAQCLKEQPDIDTKELKIFLELIKWANENTDITLSESNKKAVSETSEEGEKIILPALFKLQALDLKGTLSTEQSSVLHGIITFFTPPEEIPGAMEAYAKTIVSKFHACASNPQDLQAISQFLAEVYDEFNKIHPFPCCNDQMALCLLNLFLVALGHPSILLCHPDDDANDDSLYMRAMDDLDRSTQMLQELINSPYARNVSAGHIF